VRRHALQQALIPAASCRPFADVGDLLTDFFLQPVTAENAWYGEPGGGNSKGTNMKNPELTHGTGNQPVIGTKQLGAGLGSDWDWEFGDWSPTDINKILNLGDLNYSDNGEECDNFDVCQGDCFLPPPPLSSPKPCRIQQYSLLKVLQDRLLSIISFRLCLIRGLTSQIMSDY
jgi:hypothetical protein